MTFINISKKLCNRYKWKGLERLLTNILKLNQITHCQTNLTLSVIALGLQRIIGRNLCIAPAQKH